MTTNDPGASAPQRSGTTPDLGPRRGLNPLLAIAAIALLAAGGFGLAVGIYGRLEPCVGDCAATTSPETDLEFLIPALIAGGIVAAVGLALLVFAVLRGRHRAPDT